MGVFLSFNWGVAGGGGGCCTFLLMLGGVISRCRAVECLVSVGNCVTYNRPLLSSYKGDDVVVS